MCKLVIICYLFPQHYWEQYKTNHTEEMILRCLLIWQYTTTPQPSFKDNTAPHHGKWFYRIPHKEYTLALISAEAYCLRTCRFSRIKRRRLEVYSSKHMQRWYRDRRGDTPYPYGFFVLYRSILFFIFSYFFSILLFYLYLSLFLSIYLYSYFYNFLYLIFIYFYTHLYTSL